MGVVAPPFPIRRSTTIALRARRRHRHPTLPPPGGGLTRAALALLALFCIAAAPPDALPDAAQEQHAHLLFRQVRCLVCQNESIDDSEAPLAGDLRHLIRQQVAAGRSDADVRAFLVARYGEFVLLKPPFSPANAALWLTPFVIVGAGLAVLAARGRRTPGAPEPLGPDEEARLQAMTAEGERNPSSFS